MNRTSSHLGAALVMAAALLASTALAVAAQGAPWAAFAAPLLLVLPLLGTDAYLRSRSGLRALPAVSTLILAAMVLVACAITASSGPHRLAEMMPIFGSCASFPALQRQTGRRSSCRWI